ncbi:MAG: twin-arginine translocase TatA/TatE family subunit [Planctomycetota bacterium]
MAHIPDILAGVIGPWQLGIILVVALLIFGRRLPEIARNLGKSLAEFKKGVKDAKDEIDNAADIDDHPDTKNSPPDNS